MPRKHFSITLNSELAASARHMHKVSQIGEQRMGPNKSLEAFLSDLVTVAIVERRQQGSVREPNQGEKQIA